MTRTLPNREGIGESCRDTSRQLWALARIALPDLSPGVTVIHGPNEAGKSTLLQLIRAILYGYSVSGHQRFLPPRYDGRVGGQLTAEAPQGRFSIGRHLPAPGRVEDFELSQLSVRSLEGSMQGRHLLGMLLAGVDESVFHNVFAVGLSEMQQLGTLSDTDAARELYGLAAGGDRVSIAEVSEQLSQTQQRLATHGAASLQSLQRRQEQLQQELAEQAAHGERWFHLREQREEISAEITQLEERQRQFGDLICGNQPSQVLRDHWRECRRLHRAIRSLGSLPKIPASAIQRLESLGKQLRDHRQSWEATRQRRRKLRTKAKQLPGQASLLSEAERIDSLYKRRSQIAALSEQLQQSRKQTEEMEFELQGEMERMGLQADWRMDAVPVLTDAMVAALRAPAGQLQTARERVGAARQQEQESQQQAEQLQQQLDKHLQSLGQSNLNNAVQRQQRHVDLFRRAIELDQRAAPCNVNSKRPGRKATTGSSDRSPPGAA